MTRISFVSTFSSDIFAMRLGKCFMSQRTRHTSFWIVKQCSGKIVAHRLTCCDDSRLLEKVGIETFETSYVARFHSRSLFSFCFFAVVKM